MTDLLQNIAILAVAVMGLMNALAIYRLAESIANSAASSPSPKVAARVSGTEVVPPSVPSLSGEAV